MATSKKSTGKKSKDPTLSAAATLVSLLVRLASGEEKKIRATCGLGLEKPLADYDPTTQSWKMFGDISLWGDCRLLVNLPPSGMTVSGVLFLQPPWEPITGETESSSWPTPTAVTRPMEGNVRMFRAKIQSGEMTEQEAEAILGKSVWESQGKIPVLWPTPTAMDHLPARSQEALERQQNNNRPGRTTPPTLKDAVAYPRNWPTPTASDHIERKSTQITPGSMHSVSLPDAVKMWPTPTVDDASNVNPKANRFHGLVAEVNQYPTPTHGKMAGGTGAFNKVQELYSAGQITDEERKSMQAGNGGKLNPTWVEWLMGFPLGWTDLEDLETPSSHK